MSLLGGPHVVIGSFPTEPEAQALLLQELQADEHDTGVLWMRACKAHDDVILDPVARRHANVPRLREEMLTARIRWNEAIALRDALIAYMKHTIGP